MSLIFHEPPPLRLCGVIVALEYKPWESSRTWPSRQASKRTFAQKTGFDLPKSLVLGRSFASYFRRVGWRASGIEDFAPGAQQS